ncbi:hypothetical protein [Massilia sp.]|uniref:hypothetical protein n=1 Tax=Massilia sp. TaxID=1882437 RepID=UPI0028A193DF|nr:hypothetical protein [Massilia sp.]
MIHILSGLAGDKKGKIVVDVAAPCTAAHRFGADEAVFGAFALLLRTILDDDPG